MLTVLVNRKPFKFHACVMARRLILVWWFQQLWGYQPGSFGLFSTSCFNESLPTSLAKLISIQEREYHAYKDKDDAANFSTRPPVSVSVTGLNEIDVDIFIFYISPSWLIHSITAAIG